MEIEDTETIGLDTSIDIVEGTILQEESFTETIEISHDINITVDNNKDPLNVSLDIEEEYGLKPCFIEVEKCDKIWETMKLIRELQEPPQDFITDNSLNIDNYEMNDEESNSSSQAAAAANPMLPYIKYQPVLGNGNTAVPNFQFSVKSTRALYQCNTCGRQYSHRSTLREHSERIHNIIIPVIRKPKAEKTVKELKSLSHESFDQNDDESNHESGSTISSSPSEDKERLLDSSSETQEIEPLPMAGHKKIPVVCDHCNKLLSDKYYLKVHEALVHGVIGNFQAGTGPLILQRKFAAMSKTRHRCSECGKEFFSLAKLKEHIQIIHVQVMQVSEAEQKPVMRKQVAVKKTAKSSAKTAASLSNLARSTPAPEEPKSMVKNGKTIGLRRRIKQPPTIRTCEVCGKSYKNHTNWKIHMIKHHGIVPANCTRPRELKLNKQHTLGLYTCKYCGKGFNWSNTLRNHEILQHLKDQVCPTKTGKSDKSSVNRAKTVKNEVPVQRRLPKLVKIEEELQDQGQSSYTCSKCPKTYGSRRTLKYHLAKMHGMIFKQLRPITNRGGNNFRCKTCNQGFQKEKSMNTHILMFHGVKHLEDASFADFVVKERALGQNPIKIVSKNPPPLVPIRSLRDKERVNYDEDTLLNQKSIYKSPEDSEDSKVGTSSQHFEQTDAEPIIQCILCNRHCKKIRRHFIDFHKVRNPDILISQCQLSPLNAPKEEDIKPPVKPAIKREPVSGLMFRRKRRGTDSMKKKRTMTVPGPQMLFELVVKPFGGLKRRVYACKLCDFVAYSYEGSRKHSRLEHFGATLPPSSASSSSEPQGNGNPEIKVEPSAPVLQRRRSESMITTRKRRRESFDEREIQKRRLTSVFGGETRMTRAVKRLREELEHKCDICERMFRNADILASHKVSCRARMTVDAGIESNDTRESSDRDSGIGISITIKKKNDSYEIVSRDSSGERPSKRSMTGDAYSDASSSDTRNSSTLNDHRIIKIKKNYDDDVEIDLEQNLHDQDDDFDIVDAVDDPPPGQVLSLTDMCKRALGYTRRIPKAKKVKIRRGFPCKVCNEYWPSVKSRNTHCWKAHKVSARDNPINRVGTLREICVKVLVANGDLEAGKKVWYPCHICNTVWPSTKSRSAHRNGHKYYGALNKNELLDKVG